VKTRRRKTATPKRSNAVKFDRRRGSSAAGLSKKAALLKRERDEALEQQTATSEVLRVISSSPGDLKPTFAVILANATRLCQANFGVLFLCQGDAYNAVAMHNAPSAYVEARQREPLVSMTGTTILAQVARTKMTIQTADITKDPAYHKNPQNTQFFVRLTGARSFVAVPMLKDDELVGAIAIYRQEVRSFTEKQIELVQSFAAQAVIAIENTRLLNELRQRTDDLTEALEQQTATSEVLNVINTSPTDTQPVFDAIIQSAVRLCGAQFGVMHRFDGERLHVVAHDVTPEVLEILKRTYPMRPIRSQASGRAMLDRAVVEIRDVGEDPDYDHAMAAAGHWRSLLAVPMLRADGDAIGTIVVQRSAPGAFASSLIEMLQNFAAQAVIAIENTRLLNELRESLQQQTATSDVLKVISRSTFDLQTVLDTLVKSAARLCEADMAATHRLRGAHYEHAASYGIPPELHDHMKTIQFEPDRGSVTGRTILGRKVVHVHDVRSDPEYTLTAAVEKLGARTTLGVPLLREGLPIGVFILMRRKVRPFTDKQIELLSTFADQAVIAIENVRLFEAEQKRTAELMESLEQQTATSEVLRVISSSPGELEPVFRAMLENATRICEAKFGSLFRFDGEKFHFTAEVGMPLEFVEFNRRRSPFQARPGAMLDRVRRTKQVSHTADAVADAVPGASVTLGGTRSLVGVPMLKDDVLIGVINIYRQEVRPFTNKQIELVQNFAAQAVIAIENTRLLNELRQRTGDLTQSLEQQAATSEVLNVISRSKFDLQPILQSVVDTAARLCRADTAVIFRLDEGLYRFAAGFCLDPKYMEIERATPITPGPGTVVGRAAMRREVVRIVDAMEDPLYERKDDAEIAQVRSMIGVPLMREGEPIGVIALARQRVEPFVDREIELVSTFADQAAIAIENVRLFDDVQQRIGELRALGEVSQAVNSTLDLEKVLSTIVAKAVQLTNTMAGAIYGYDEWTQEFRLRATYGMDQDLIDALTHHHIGFDEPNVALAFAQREPVQIADLKEEARSDLNDLILRAGYRARLVAPLLRGEDIVGMLVVRRKMPGQFAQNTIDLIKTFAAQSALAIQNARLFDSVETRTRELAKSLEDLRAAQDRLVQTQKLASLGQLTAGIAHEIKNPLNFVNNFSGVSVELIDELKEALQGVSADDKTRTEIAELADTLRDNLDKIVQHGKRADSIVKNMLLHSREGSGEHRAVDINALVEEGLNLAYHGARAEKQGFEITLARSFDPTAGEVDLFPQDISRVLLNVISNGFYAATKRKHDARDTDHEPTLSASTINLGDRVEIRIRDNGTGIPPEVKEKMFNPFFTTKPAGEGTGLGLSISHDIIVKQHGGSIDVDTQPGSFTEIRIVLPRMAAFHA
jgi:GAF domain-containing protein